MQSNNSSRNSLIKGLVEAMNKTTVVEDTPANTSYNAETRTYYQHTFQPTVVDAQRSVAYLQNMKFKLSKANSPDSNDKIASLDLAIDAIKKVYGI